jgi:hypothetical protein
MPVQALKKTPVQVINQGNRAMWWLGSAYPK